MSFPAPDTGFITTLDLNTLLVKRPAATFFMRVEGDRMAGDCIHDGDMLIVDRSLPPAQGKFVVAAQAGELVVRTVRTVLEINGTACIPVEGNHDPKQGIQVTRCFGRPVTELEEMKQAIATHTSRLAEKLRQDELATQRLIVSMRTNRFATIPQYAASQEIKLERATNLTDQLLHPALEDV